ncbi:MAG: phosphate ABC transporter substrate-binding protein [Bacillota bacterium]
MISRRGLSVACVLVLVSVVAGCGGSPTPAQEPSEEPAKVEPVALEGSIDVRGSDTMVNLGATFAEAFMDKHPEVSIVVQGGGSGTGIKALMQKNTDIAQASRKAKDSEIEEGRANGVDMVETVVAWDGLSVVVNLSNPLDSITMEDLGAIYRGQITNWKELGGPDLAIAALARDTASGTHVFFKEHVVQMGHKDAEYGDAVQMLPSTAAVVAEVEQSPNAIGYIGLGYYDPSKVKMLGIPDASGNPVMASIETVKSGTYTLARPLQVYTNGQPSGLIKEYVDFMLGPEGQGIVLDLDFVPVK